MCGPARSSMSPLPRKLSSMRPPHMNKVQHRSLHQTLMVRSRAAASRTMRPVPPLGIPTAQRYPSRRHAPSSPAAHPRPSCASDPPSTQRRAQGRPGAGRARGPPAAKKQAAVTTGLAEHTRPSLRDGWNGLYVVSLVRRACWPPCRDNALARTALDTSVGVSGPHDFAVRNEPFVRAARGHAAIPCAHRIPPPTSRDGRDTPLRRKQDGQRYTSVRKK
ncbi:protein of unknown function [Bradyrhizobium sp. ORS 285]|nr:protein of unknown function [Bradyrhizobium sp. ORS 285]